ncbi:MAG: hypothetical protein ABI658_12910 [Acidimicrobiales bacterium]
MPEILQRFRLRDWAHLVGPEPEHWGGGMTGDTWAGFKARSLFLQARAEWRRESGSET